MGGGGGGGGSRGNIPSSREMSLIAQNFILDTPGLEVQTEDGPCLREQLQTTQAGDMRMAARPLLEETVATGLVDTRSVYEAASTVRQCGRLGCTVGCVVAVDAYNRLKSDAAYVRDDSPTVKCDESLLLGLVKKGLSHKDARA